jgi:universal stress protein E
MEKTNILVVYDPTKEAQPALERAVSIAEATPCNLHVFCCIHADIPKNADKATTVRQQLDEQRAVIEQTVAELEPGSTEVTIGLEWDKDWYQAVVRASISKNADVVLKSTYRHSVAPTVRCKRSWRPSISAQNRMPTSGSTRTLSISVIDCWTRAMLRFTSSMPSGT